MPDRTDRDRLADFIQIIGAEPREVEFDDEGHLTELNLAGLNLTSLPSAIGQFVHLQKLILGLIIPDEQGNLLHLSNNVVHFPPEMSRLSNLRELVLWNNPLTTLPLEITQLTSATTKLKVRIAKSAHMWETF